MIDLIGTVFKTLLWLPYHTLLHFRLLFWITFALFKDVMCAWVVLWLNILEYFCIFKSWELFSTLKAMEKYYFSCAYYHPHNKKIIKWKEEANIYLKRNIFSNSPKIAYVIIILLGDTERIHFNRVLSSV